MRDVVKCMNYEDPKQEVKQADDAQLHDWSQRGSNVVTNRQASPGLARIIFF
jgi:hypothetical protein